jgi:hypothetical protein
MMQETVATKDGITASLDFRPNGEFLEVYLKPTKTDDEMLLATIRGELLAGDNKSAITFQNLMHDIALWVLQKKFGLAPKQATMTAS